MGCGLGMAAIRAMDHFGWCSLIATDSGRNDDSGKNRGEPVSAVSPHVRAFQIALGVTVASSAATLAAYFV